MIISVLRLVIYISDDRMPRLKYSHRAKRMSIANCIQWFKLLVRFEIFEPMRIMRVPFNIRFLFVSKKRSEDLKLARLMYGGDTWMPTFIFKSTLFKSARCLFHGWQFAYVSQIVKKVNRETSYHAKFDFRMWVFGGFTIRIYLGGVHVLFCLRSIVSASDAARDR